ncbi:hypothetical protein ABTD12_20415, partial [Acinetobacter baumannii]
GWLHRAGESPALSGRQRHEQPEELPRLRQRPLWQHRRGTGSGPPTHPGLHGDRRQRRASS